MSDITIKKKVLECFTELCKNFPELISDKYSYFQENLDNLVYLNILISIF